MTLRLSILLATVLAATAPAGRGVAAPQAGEELRGRMPFLKGTVLLPPGPWVVAAIRVKPTAALEGAELMSVVLLQPQDGAVAGVVLAQGNVAPLAYRPNLSSECWSDQAYFTAVTADDESGGACVAVEAVAAPTQNSSSSDLWGEARAFAASHNWQVPSAYMVATLRSVDRTGLMDLGYALPIPDRQVKADTASCAWTEAPGDTAAASVRQAAQELTNFSSAMLPILEIAGQSPLPLAVMAPSLTMTRAGSQDLLMALKQARIDDLVEEGAVPPAQAEALSRRAAEPSPGDALIKQLAWRSGYKTLTYKSATYIDTSVIYYLFVPDLPLVLIGSAITNVLGMPIVYINDFAWSYFGLKSAKSRQPFALPGIGTVCPSK